MKVFIDTEYAKYLVDAHNDWASDDLSVGSDIYELCGVAVDSDTVFVLLRTPRGTKYILNCPPDVFGGTSDFAIGLNQGIVTRDWEGLPTVFFPEI